MQKNAAKSEAATAEPALFVDTNIFLELQFEDSRWRECLEFLKKVETGEIFAFTSDFVVYSSVLEISSKKPKKKELNIETFLTAISTMQGLSILRPTIDEMSNAVASMAKRKLDFDDSLVVSAMVANNITTLVSFDRHFDGIKEIKRVEPIQVFDNAK